MPDTYYLNNDSLLDFIIVNKRGGLSYFRGTNDSTLSSFLINNNSVLNLKIFPNPSKNIIQIDNLHNSIEYEILTNYGSIIKKGSTNGKVNIEFLSNGIYFLRLKTKFNQQVLKFVKWF